MIFNDLIKSHSWLSIEMTLLNLYPDQEDLIEEYRRVFNKLQVLKSDNSEMLIVLTEYESDTTDGNQTSLTYVDVSGRKLFAEINSISESYAIEFVIWEEWLGMELAPETLEKFSELEIIAHCLFEMTFCGYEQEEIQEQLNSINNIVDEYKGLTAEEKQEQTISLEELKKKLDDKGGG